VEAVEEFERVILAALRGCDRERDQCCQSSRGAHLRDVRGTLALGVDHQRSQSRDRQRVQPAETLGQHP
jgi:hypothetical protein